MGRRLYGFSTVNAAQPPVHRCGAPGRYDGRQGRRSGQSHPSVLESPVHDRLCRNSIIHHGRLDKGVQLIVKPFSFNELAVKVRDVMHKVEPVL